MTDEVMHKQRIIVNISDEHSLNREVAALCDIIVFSPSNYSHSDVAGFLSYAAEVGAAEKVYLALPVVADHKDIEVLRSILKRCKVAGVLCENLYAVSLALDYGIKFLAGAGLNIYNSEAAKWFLSMGGDFIYSAELSFYEIDEIEQKLDKKGFVFVYGDMRAMTLSHCPIQTVYGKGCGECAYDEGIIYQDEKGYSFPLRRVKVDGCHFELFNSAKLDGIRRKIAKGHDAYFVFFDVRASRVCDIINSFKDANLPLQTNVDAGFTTGQLFKGVK